MSEQFQITLAQLNPVMGDLKGNAAKALSAWAEGKAAGSDLVVLPELFLIGYNPQDLVRRPALVREADAWLAWLATETADGPALAIGAPWAEGTELFNAYHILQGGRVLGRQLKHELPNETVFDERRIFTAAPLQGPISLGPIRIGFPICEDAWHDSVAETHAESGADLLIVPNGSPYYRGKHLTRLNHMVARTVETGLALIYLNMVGGQDDQAFDGGSFALNPGGALALQCESFVEEIRHVVLEHRAEGWRIRHGDCASHGSDWEEDYHAMVLSLRDYLRKNGFRDVLLGLSGGVDSALVAVIAADAIGPENVRGVMLPSRYTSEASLRDAADLAKRLGIRLDEVSISAPVAAANDALREQFQGLEPDITEENIQSRMRGLLLMALSNKTGAMLLTTGNKSEVAVGYATIYGDMAGGYNPLKDLYKTRVFETCRWRNAHHRAWMAGPIGEVIPPVIIDKPPTAELRENQQDADSLPPYESLDRMLEILVDLDGTVGDCVAEGFSEAEARRVERLIFLSEYKRFQSAPGTRLTKHAFWLDRRYPITNRWRSPS